MARPAAGGPPGESRSDAGVLQEERGKGWLTPISVAIGVCTLLALGLRLFLLSRPGYLLGVTEYDDGPYFGSAVNLIHGYLPYRSFVLVQPPGITLLMVPSALLSKVTGTATAMATGRILTTLASSAGVVLVGLLLRRRGLPAVIVGCGILAVYPDSVATARTVLVEPWLVLFCLLGALALFDGNHLTSSGKRLFWGGVAFGFAGCVEVWAIFPVIVAVVLLLPRIRRAAVYVGGVAVGFVVPTLPFAALAPKRFYQSLYVAQVAPRAGSTRVPLPGPAEPHARDQQRRASPQPSPCADPGGDGGPRRRGGRDDRRGLAGPPPGTARAGLVGAGHDRPHRGHVHVAGPVPLSLRRVPGAVLRHVDCAARVPAAGGAQPGRRPAVRCGRAPPVGAGRGAGRPGRRGAGPGPGQLSNPMSSCPLARVPAAVEKIIPKGACVATDQVSYLLMANRFSPDEARCPHMLDGLGSDLGFSNGLKPSTGAGNVPAVQAMWQDEFSHAQFVWLSYNSYRRVAWDKQLRAYFGAHFVQVFKHGWHDTLWARKGAHTG